MAHFTTEAFPPAPHHLIEGTVRNELGNPLAAGGGTVVLETDTGTKLTAAIRSGLPGGFNYEIEVPMDSGVRPAPYFRSALFAAVPFKMHVILGGVRYLPIEMRGDFSSLGKPGGTSIINLTLGEDADGDGLPDAWERAMMRALGLNGLKSVNPNDDSDGDGMTNLQEYTSGNFAFDKDDGLVAKISGFHQGNPVLEFMAVRGRSYTLHGSTDLNEWTPVSFYVPADGEGAKTRDSFQADSFRVVQVAVPAPAIRGTARFFKIRVQ